MPLIILSILTFKSGSRVIFPILYTDLQIYTDIAHTHIDIQTFYLGCTKKEISKISIKDNNNKNKKCDKRSLQYKFSLLIESYKN